MFDQLDKPRNFGVNDKPPCANCGQPTSLIRRSPDHFDRRCERQIFACFKCDNEVERLVDESGKFPALARSLAENPWTTPTRKK
jgi:hypothetical protein